MFRGGQKFAMNLNTLFEATGEPFTYFPGFVERYGISVNASVLLCFLAWRDFDGDANGWRLLNASDITERTGLTLKEQRTARAQLVQAKLIEENYARLEHKLRFRIIGEEPAQSAKSENGQMPKGQMAIRPIGISSIEKNRKEDNKGNLSQCADAQKGESDLKGNVQRQGKVFAKPSMEDVQTFCVEIGLTAADGAAFWYGKQANGWMNGKSKIKSWKATVRQWQLLGYMPSQKKPKEPFQGQGNDWRFAL